LVPSDRVKLTAKALCKGFDYDFASAIHLLCPQLENIVRVLLKNAGVITSNVDENGIEKENGLSTLLTLPETKSLFDKDICFELQAVFTAPYGPNLRNEVAHGLLNDSTSSSLPSIYGWWLVLRLIVRSLMGENFGCSPENTPEQS